MRMTETRLRSLVLVLLLVLVTTGCPAGPSVTDAGNPMHKVPRAASILASICAKLTTCYPPLPGYRCSQGISGTNNLDAALGLPPAYFGSYQEIIAAEAAGSLTPHAAAADRCIADLNSLSCGPNPGTSSGSASSGSGDSGAGGGGSGPPPGGSSGTGGTGGGISGAWSPSNPEDFSHVVTIMPGSCSGVY